jgi:hypothetical protein
MRRWIVAAGVLALVLGGLVACSSDDEGNPTGLPEDDDLQTVAECGAAGIKFLGAAVQASVALFHHLDRDPYFVAPSGFGYDAETGEFSYYFNPDGDPRDRHVVAGTVAPVSVVEDGLQQRDNFTVDWFIRDPGTMDEIAHGTFRVIHNGLTLPPGQTETMRMIPADVVWAEPYDDCHSEFTQLELVVHHLLREDEVRSALVSFWTAGTSADTLTGYLAMAGEEIGTISGTYQGVSYTCSMNFVTYVVDCSK